MSLANVILSNKLIGKQDEVLLHAWTQRLGVFDSDISDVTRFFAKWNLFYFKQERILDLLWSTAACRLPLVVNGMLSPNYHYWIRVSRAPQNCRMIILRPHVYVRKETFLLSSVIPSLKSFNSPLALFYSRLLGWNSTFVTLEEKLHHQRISLKHT